MKKPAKFYALVFVLIFGASLLFNATRAEEDNASFENHVLLTEDETKTLYDKHCAKCHGKDGRAKSFRGKLVHAQDFTDKAWQESTTDDQMIEVIKNGSGKMPDFGKKLKDEQIKSLIEYIRKFIK